MPNKPSMLDICVGFLMTRSWVRPSDFQKYLLLNYDRHISDAAATARFRDLRKSRYGGFDIQSRPCEKGSAHEYRLIREEI